MLSHKASLSSEHSGRSVRLDTSTPKISSLLVRHLLRLLMSYVLLQAETMGFRASAVSPTIMSGVGRPFGSCVVRLSAGARADTSNKINARYQQGSGLCMTFVTCQEAL